MNNDRNQLNEKVTVSFRTTLAMKRLIEAMCAKKTRERLMTIKPTTLMNELVLEQAEREGLLPYDGS